MCGIKGLRAWLHAGRLGCCFVVASSGSNRVTEESCWETEHHRPKAAIEEVGVTAAPLDPDREPAGRGRFYSWARAGALRPRRRSTKRPSCACPSIRDV